MLRPDNKSESHVPASDSKKAADTKTVFADVSGCTSMDRTVTVNVSDVKVSSAHISQFKLN